MTDLLSFIQQKNELDAALAARPDDSAAISIYRRGCIGMLEGIDPENCSSELLKTIVSVCADCCKTRIAIDRNPGCESVFPVLIAEDERAFCVALHDRCCDLLRQAERMYIPEPVERDKPSGQKLTWLIRQALSDSDSARKKAQQDGTQFSRLFGSRG